jgi:hypothetical protein
LKKVLLALMLHSSFKQLLHVTELRNSSIDINATILMIEFVIVLWSFSASFVLFLKVYFWQEILYEII